MDLQDFKQSVTILSIDKSNKTRDKYVKKFVNVNKEHYKMYVEKYHQFVDGNCYIGYLWDCLKEPNVITFEGFKDLLNDKDKIYVFWDIHSKERILIEDYWKFDKRVVLCIDSKIFFEGLDFLPEDIYIFDENMNWTLILTHEYLNSERYCLKSGGI
jgi:hypothetical protein